MDSYHWPAFDPDRAKIGWAGLLMLNSFGWDWQFSIRWLTRHPKFLTVAVTTFAFALAATAVVAAVFEAVVLRAVPGPNASALVSVATVDPKSPALKGGLAYPDVRQLEQEAGLFRLVGSFRTPGVVELSVEKGSRHLSTVSVSEQFFNLFEVQPQLGRWSTGSDFDQPSDLVVVLSDDTWRREFAADPTAIGRIVRLDGQDHRIVGVAPPRFRMPVPADIWLPDRSPLRALTDYSERQCHVIALLSNNQATNRTKDFQKTFSVARADGPAQAVSISLLREDMIGPVSSVLAVGSLVALLLLGLACLNVGSLFLARNAGRHRELAIRAALGASTYRILRVCFLESLSVSVGGGVLGLLLAYPVLAAIKAFGPTSIPGLAEATLDRGVLIAALLISTAAGLLCGVLARQGSVSSLINDSSLLNSNRGWLRNADEGTRRRTVFLVGQVALAVMLVTASSVALQKMARLLTIEIGFNVSDLMVLQLTRPPRPDIDAVATQRIMEDISRFPGVTSVAAVAYLRHMPVMTLAAERSQGEWIPFPSPTLTYQVATENIFETLGVPLLDGRTFGPQDTWRAPCTLLVNRTLASAAWPERRAVGKRLNLSTDHDGRPLKNDQLYCEVIGVVGDIRTQLETKPGPQVYLWYRARRFTPGTDTFLVRFSGPKTSRAHMLMAKEVAPRFGRRIEWAGSLESLVTQSIVPPRFYAYSLGAVAILALTLAAVGVYGSLAETVSLRRREFALRIAVGATPGDLRRLVLGFALVRLGLGIGMGAILSAVVNQLMAAWLFDMPPANLTTLGAASVVMLVAGLVAVADPIRKASSVHPADVLR